MALFSKLLLDIRDLQDKDLVDYKRQEIINQRRILKLIRNEAHRLRIVLAEEKQRRYRSVLRNKARMIKQEQNLEKLKANRKKITHNPYFKT